MERRTWSLVPLVAAVMLAASCAEHPTAPTIDARRAQSDAANVKKDKNRAALLTDIPVAGKLSDGGTFIGTFTATHFDIDEATRQLSVTGTLTGTATTIAGQAVQISQTVTAPAEMSRMKKSKAAMFQPTAATVCDVLFLDLGPLNLDLLGLTLDLAEVVLDLNAVSGPGNLLGNLLCAVVGLLDGFGLLAAITDLLNTINNILAGLSPGGATGAALMAPSLFAPSPAAMTSA